jgi:hypothetical protein
MHGKIDQFWQADIGGRQMLNVTLMSETEGEILTLDEVAVYLKQESVRPAALPRRDAF